MQSSTFWSFGSNETLPARPVPAAIETKAATCWISVGDSLLLNDGMPFPPFVTCLLTVCSLGRSSSRLGPIVPFAPAASIVWQFAQPAVENTFSPGVPLPAALSLDDDDEPLPPHPVAVKTNTARRTVGAARRRMPGH